MRCLLPSLAQPLTATNGTLVLDGEGNIYGNTQAGGEIGGGAIFQLTRSGSEWTESVLHSFLQDSDGFYPTAGPVFDGQGNLYGTTAYGGSGTDQLCNGDVGCGTVYELSPSGSGIWSETVLYSFTGGNDGSNPFAGLILDGQGNLYTDDSLHLPRAEGDRAARNPKWCPGKGQSYPK